MRKKTVTQKLCAFSLVGDASTRLVSFYIRRSVIRLTDEDYLRD